MIQSLEIQPVTRTAVDDSKMRADSDRRGVQRYDPMSRMFDTVDVTAQELTNKLFTW